MSTPWLILPFGVLAAAAATAGSPSTPWPTAGWTASSPRAEGMDRAVLEKLDAELASGQQGYVDGMLVIRHGKVVFERSYKHDYERLFESSPDQKRALYNYYDPEWHPYYQKSELHTMQSVSKSVTSALVGIAIGRGELPGVDAKVGPAFEGFEGDGDPRQAHMTLQDLLTMRSGIRWDESTVTYTDPRNSCAQMEASKDWVRFVWRQPMAAEPGKVFVYNSGVTVLLAQVLHHATGKAVPDYARENLFGPLGITDFQWKRTPTGLADTEGGLYLTPRDLAKVGYLYLHDGVWNGQRVLPEGWVHESTEPRVVTGAKGKRAYRYGYQWWEIPDATGKAFPAYAALGYGGQYLIVVPRLDLIAVFTGWNIYDKPELSSLMVFDRVVSAVKPAPAP